MGLTRAGWIAAAIVGASSLAGGGWRFAAVLLAFFISSMLLSRLHGAKHERRNAWQVAANGGVAAACALVCAGTRSPLAGAAFAGAFAAANADTWATEIGTRFGGVPRSILSGRTVPRGLSGGITAAGTLAQAAGALLVGAVAAATGTAMWWAVAAGGLGGAFADSIAGAAGQEVRYCDVCREECESDPHGCGAPTRHIRGASWLRNDGVNFVCTAAGAALAALLSAWR